MSRQFGGGGPGRQVQRTKVLGFALAGMALFVCVFVVLLIFTSPQSKANQSNAQNAPNANLEFAEVLVPVQQIEPGTALEPTMFKKEKRPKLGLPQRVVKDFEEVKGQYSRSIIVADLPLSQEYLTQVKPANTITARIPEGYRAVTINVDIRTSVEGWARPGARVDVIWASRIRNKEAVTVIVQNAVILSAERQTESSNQQAQQSGILPGRQPQAQAAVPNTVTLLVSAKDAQKIQLASTTGSLSLSLRGDTDAGQGQASGSITIDQLISDNAPQEQQPNGKEPIEGTVRIKGPSGNYEEWVLKGGRLEPKGK
jgi:pilus assembly protein CpaB